MGVDFDNTASVSSDASLREALVRPEIAELGRGEAGVGLAIIVPIVLNQMETAVSVTLTAVDSTGLHSGDAVVASNLINNVNRDRGGFWRRLGGAVDNALFKFGILLDGTRIHILATDVNNFSLEDGEVRESCTVNDSAHPVRSDLVARCGALTGIIVIVCTMASVNSVVGTDGGNFLVGLVDDVARLFKVAPGGKEVVDARNVVVIAVSINFVADTRHEFVNGIRVDDIFLFLNCWGGGWKVLAAVGTKESTAFAKGLGAFLHDVADVVAVVGINLARIKFRVADVHAAVAGVLCLVRGDNVALALARAGVTLTFVGFVIEIAAVERVQTGEAGIQVAGVLADFAR